MSKDLLPPKKKNNMLELISEISTNLENVKTTTDERRGVARISGSKGNSLFSCLIEESELGTTQTLSEYKMLDKKSDYEEEVKRLRSTGLKQTDIALRLGISQALVSKLSKK